LVRLLMPVLLHRTESKRGPSAAWCSFGRTDIPEIHPETPHGGISKKLNVLFIPSSGIPRSRLLDSRRWLDSPSVRTRLCRWRFTFRWPSICLFENRGSLRNLSILDRVKDRAEALTRQFSSSDSLRLDEDLGSVREMETRVEAMRKSLEKAQDAAKGQNRPVFSMERSANGMPEDFRDRTCQGA